MSASDELKKRTISLNSKINTGLNRFYTVVWDSERWKAMLGIVLKAPLLQLEKLSNFKA